MQTEFEMLYKKYFKDVYFFVLSMSRDAHLAEEITQETFFRALKKSGNFQGKCSVKSWLCQIARNLYISYMRKRKDVHIEMIEEIPDEADVEMGYVRKSEVLSIYRILHCLKEPYKEVFVLRVLGELSFREIGEVFAKSESWARVTFHRAKVRIQEKISEQEGDV